jgi:hypothetical protein
VYATINCDSRIRNKRDPVENTRRGDFWLETPIEGTLEEGRIRKSNG